MAPGLRIVAGSNDSCCALVHAKAVNSTSAAILFIGYKMANSANQLCRFIYPSFSTYTLSAFPNVTSLSRTCLKRCKGTVWKGVRSHHSISKRLAHTFDSIVATSAHTLDAIATTAALRWIAYIAAFVSTVSRVVYAYAEWRLELCLLISLCVCTRIFLSNESSGNQKRPQP